MTRTLVLALALSLAPMAHAKGARKPSVCADFRVSTATDANGARSTMGVCFDSGKPSVWSAWTIVEVTSPDGAKARYAVGFR